MNLRWNGTFRRFEVEFSSDFQGDLAAVKAVGFKTDGAPEWIWHTQKVTVLQKLRENRPASGLTITPEARAQYTPLAELEEKNAKIKAALAVHTKEQKKKLENAKKDANALVVPEKGYIGAEDLPPQPVRATAYNPPPPPTTKCIICADPIYFYEKQDPPTCLWCEIIVLDNATEVC